jgi:ABC-type polysaccharide/polyol phosphate transport system ATPase subunit
MYSFRENSTSVLAVSNSLDIIIFLCQSGILLGRGRILELAQRQIYERGTTT